jgi:hypothetical protein
VLTDHRPSVVDETVHVEDWAGDDFSTASAPIGKIMVAAMTGERMPTERSG